MKDRDASILIETTFVADGYAQNWYRQRGDEVGPASVKHTVVLSKRAWKEMGEPKTITVTIQVGDRLNG